MNTLNLIWQSIRNSNMGQFSATRKLWAMPIIGYGIQWLTQSGFLGVDMSTEDQRVANAIGWVAGLLVVGGDILYDRMNRGV